MHARRAIFHYHIIAAVPISDAAMPLPPPPPPCHATPLRCRHAAMPDTPISLMPLRHFQFRHDTDASRYLFSPPCCHVISRYHLRISLMSRRYHAAYERR